MNMIRCLLVLSLITCGIQGEDNEFISMKHFMGIDKIHRINVEDHVVADTSFRYHSIVDEKVILEINALLGKLDSDGEHWKDLKVDNLQNIIIYHDEGKYDAFVVYNRNLIRSLASINGSFGVGDEADVKSIISLLGLRERAPN